MYLTKTVKLLPNKEQIEIINNLFDSYNAALTYIMDIYIASREGSDKELTTRDIPYPLPSSMKDACIKDAKAMYKKYLKLHYEDVGHMILNPGCDIPMRKPVISSLYGKWKKDTFYIKKDHISLPAWKDGAYKRIEVKCLMPDDLYVYLKNHNPISLQLKWKKKKLIALLTVMADEKPIYDKTTDDIIDTSTENVSDVISRKHEIMGIDLNIKCPAVCVTTSGNVLFAGNGKEIQYLRRHYNSVRNKFRKEGKKKELQALSHKEQNCMKDIDHKISRKVIDFAIKNNVTEIRMERLTGIRENANIINKKQKKALATWSYYRLSEFIAYKAKLNGIKITYVSPVFTSQICPKCKEKTKIIKGAIFSCPVCGYTVHDDLLAAMNIRDGKPLPEKEGYYIPR